MIYVLGELSKALGGELRGDSALKVTGISPIDDGVEGHVSILLKPHQKDRALACASSVIVLGEAIEGIPHQIIVRNPKKSMDQVMRLFHPKPKTVYGIASTAVIHESAQVSSNTVIGDYVVIGEGAQISDGVCIEPYVRVGAGVQIGKNTMICASVVIGDYVQIGEACYLGPHATLGYQGFGFYPGENGHLCRMAHVAKLKIGNRVEIGSHTCIDRGCLTDTILADGVKIDNLCQIAHNVQIGENSLLAGGSILAGSVKIGRSVLMGGDVSVADNVTIADNLIIEGRSGVTKDLNYPKGSIIGGFPAGLAKEFWKHYATLNRLVKNYHKSKKEQP